MSAEKDLNTVPRYNKVKTAPANAKSARSATVDNPARVAVKDITYSVSGSWGGEAYGTWASPGQATQTQTTAYSDATTDIETVAPLGVTKSTSTTIAAPTSPLLTAGINAVQTIVVTTAAAGDTAKLTFNAHEGSVAITSPAGGIGDITAEMFKLAIVSISDFATNTSDIQVTKDGNSYAITFINALGSQAIGALTVTSKTATWANNAVAQTVTGAGGGTAERLAFSCSLDGAHDCYISLFDSTGNLATAVVTDTDGSYNFDGLDSGGVYTASVVSYVAATPSGVSTPAKAVAKTVTVTSGQSSTSV